jgi:hypothetical protein
MTSNVRSLTNFNEFPGEIDYEKNVYKFPALYKINKHGKLSIWQIYIRLVKKVKGLKNQQRDQNWSLMEDITLPLESDYLEDAESIPEGTIAQIWVEKGIEGGLMSRFPPTYASAKNKGKSDMRNALMSALISSRTKYIDMKDKGYTSKKSKAKNDNKKGDSYGMLYPMLAVMFKEERNAAVFPGIGQPKIDGVHCVVYLHVPPEVKKKDDIDDDNITIENVIMYSRANKDFPGLAHIRKQLLPILINAYDWERHESIYLDGELYVHGSSLQQITSLARNKDKNSKPKKNPLYLWLFDCFYPSSTETYLAADQKVMTFTERYKILTDLFVGDYESIRYDFDADAMLEGVEEIKRLITNEEVHAKGAEDDSDVEVPSEINYRGYHSIGEVSQMISFMEDKKNHTIVGFDALETKKYGYCVLVPNTRVESFFQFELYYHGLLSAGFEGAMYRNMNGGYLTNLGSDDSRRSIDLQKHKPTYAKEFVVVGFTTGKGSNAGAVIWQCKTKKGNVVFNVTPKNSSISTRRRIYSSIKNKKGRSVFKDKYKGRMYTVEYEDISDNGTPLRAKGIGFRDID